jgi:polysaccharide biosynthesis/export protein
LGVMRGFRILGVVFVLVNALGGCLFLPSSGPNSLDVSVGASPSGTTYTVIKLTPEVVKTLAEYGPLTLSAAFGDKRPPPEIKFGIGDVVSVSVFEAAAGGLFIPIEAGVRPGNFVTLPNQPVDTSGNISVPYAGAIKTAGRTPSQVGQTIVDAIKTLAIEPQVVVALVTQNTSLISVLGEVNAPNRFPAMPAGEHLLDSITRGGGIKDHGYSSWVVLERNGRRAAVPFGAMIYEPGNNIWTWPGDTIYVYSEPQTFLAFGAMGGAQSSLQGQQGQFAFNAWRVSLAEAVALAGGLGDAQADPSSVFLYRREPRELAEKLGIDCSKYEGPTVPVVYNVSFKDPGGYFLATKVQMYNKDVIYTANSQSVDVTKFFNFVNTVVAPVNGIATTGIDIETLRVLSHTR